MKRANLIEVAWLVGSLVVAVAVVVGTADETSRAMRGSRSRAAGVLVDASGYRVAPRTFHRIASGSILVDRIVMELAAPNRIVGLSRYGSTDSAFDHVYGDRTPIDPNGDLETLLELAPDLLFVNNFVEPRRLARLRDAGIVVFDLGEMHGLATLDQDILVVARLLGEERRGAELARRFRQRLRQVAIDVPESRRKNGMYLGVHGTQLYGGAGGTSYHDVLEAAGLIDIAATRHQGWPAMTSEDILVLDPDVIVSPIGQGRGLCRHVGLAALRACRHPGGIVEIDGALLVEPGLSMLEAAEEIRLEVYGLHEAAR
jgi:iron complex transport system substrate-binding protein